MFFKFDRYTQGSFGHQYRHVQASSNSAFGQNYRLNRYNTPTDNLAADSILEEWLPKSAQMLNRLFRNIHKFDSIAGPAVDLISLMPFSDVTLIGIEDPKILEVYEQSLAELHLETLLPEIACEYLVIGRVVGSLLFDKTKGIWTDIILQDPDFCDITNIPLRGYDPKIDLKLSDEFKRFLLSKDPRDITAKKDMPEDFLKLLLSADKLPLDPASTLYLPRKTYPNDYLGSSVYYRVLPFYALEKTLINGTLVGAKRRQRSILHVTVGEPDMWEPDEDEISSIAGMFMRADEDPQGAIVATRNGVATNEVRSGSDFWKLSDEWDFLSSAKMRALGISEAFLCLTGDTLITTENGLQRIDQMKLMNKDIHSISTKVLSKDNKEGTAVQWIYRGISNIQETITENGRLLKSTKEHRVLVLENGELIWKEAGCLKQGDNLCVNTASYTKKTKLELNLPVWEDKKHATCTKKLKAPQYMTPELAYLLGLIVSEGSHSCRISFSNSRIELLDKYARLMLDVFGLQTKRESSSKKGDPYVIKGISGICNVDSYCEEVESIVLAFWLKYLGLYTDQSIDGKFPSYYKIIPWCILQADEESQLAYLAAYLEGDGTLASKKGITFYSASRTNLRMIQALLGSHGILSRVLENYPVVSLDIRSSSLLYEKIKKYLISKTSIPSFIESKIHKNGTYGGRKFGLPTERLRIFLKSRKQKTTGLGAWFINDNGESIFIEKWGVIDRSSWQYLLYESYQKGNYFKFLEALKQISKVEYGRTIKLLELRYFYDKVKTIKEGEKQTVYDLTMDKVDEPAFIAEGIVVHNSGDATYNCCTGDSLIPTEHGLLRIDEIAKGHEGAIKDIDLMVGSKQGKAKAVKWLNNGIQDTLKITDECGHSLSCTPKHAFLVLKNNELIWVEAKDLKIDDIVCINTKPLVRKELLKLNLSYKESNGNRPRGDIYTPEYMTPELAFILGCLVAEGSIKEKADVIFYNSNEKLIEKYSEYIEEVFGLQTVKWINTPKGARRVIKGKETFATTDCYQVLTCHQTLVDWLIELGLCGWHKKPQDKIIPWSILQADEQSQLAFLAAYLDGDGTIGGNIQYFSSSEVLINQLQALLNIHGIPSVRAQRKTVISLSIGNIDSFKLWNLIKQYMITKNFTKTYTSEIRKGKGLGIPTESIKEFLNSRKVKSNRMGMVFKNDGEVEIIFKNAGRIFHLADLEKFSYDSYDLEKYDKFLEYLKQISEIEYDKLIELFNLRYRFTKIVNCEDNGKQKVYDLSMSKENEPVYVSCCFQTHNTMEISLSVFIENLRTFRDNLVSRIFYEKMFPILAEIHGFRKRTQAELAHRIRIEGKTVDSSLIIPQFNFHKQLRPEADTAYLEVLSTMEEKGIPVPLRTWAAAGGLNLEKIFDMKDEDIENRKSVQEWKDKVEKEAGGGETGVGKEGGGGEAPPPEKGGAWGSLINAHAEAIKKSLDSLPIWINNRFCGTSKDKFISIFKANNPSKKLMALYRNKSKQLETANYVLHRMGMNQLPFNVSATQDVASFLKRCASFYTPRKIAGEFTFLNKIIREGQIFQKSKHYNKKLETMLPSSMNEHLYSGIV